MADLNNEINFSDIPNGDEQDFYTRFKDKLIDVEQFPSLYTFKFIVKSDNDKTFEVIKIFKHPSSNITFNESSGGKYRSITIETFVNNADEVIDYYKAVSKIDSVIML